MTGNPDTNTVNARCWSKNLLNDIQAAEFLGMKPQTLRNWRHQRKGPDYIKFDHSVRYREEDLRDFVEARLINPTSNGLEVR